MAIRIRILTTLAILTTFVLPVDAAEDRDRVNALADRFVTEFREKFPIYYAYVGLTLERHDGLDINAPADIAQWRETLKRLSAELEPIDPDELVGKPQWVTWHFLNQALKQEAATAVCRNELWSVGAWGWQAGLSLIADLQPVGSNQARAEALARWRKLGPWIEQEIANLREGQRAGYSATRASVQATIRQLDGLLANAPDKSPYMKVAERDKTPAFIAEWTKVMESSVWPGLERYRAYLRDQYMPRARTTPSLESHPNGRECYRGLILSIVTIDADPRELFEIALKKVERERALALQLGRKFFGDKATDWNSLAKLMRADPRNTFKTAEEVREYTQKTYERAHAAGGKIVLTAPTGKVRLEPFPEFEQASAPGGQYMPAADDGSRPATYYYRHTPKDLYRLSLQNVILHETLPGHHLQFALLAEHGRKDNHTIARLLFFSGPGEGWATYSEDFAHEIGLYDSDLDYIGGLMASVTPMMVADLGMQLNGWSIDRAIEYLKEAIPLRPEQRAAQSVTTITSIPGSVFAYPLGGMQWEKMRARAEEKLGDHFDVRAFHQVLLEDGMLPFAALDAKLDRWIAREAR